MTVGEFWEAVDDVCEQHYGSVVSGRRSSMRNARVGGHPRSRHLKGLGADVIFDGTVADVALAYARRVHALHGYVRRGNRTLHLQDRAASPPVVHT